MKHKVIVFSLFSLFFLLIILAIYFFFSDTEEDDSFVLAPNQKKVIGDFGIENITIKPIELPTDIVLREGGSPDDRDDRIYNIPSKETPGEEEEEIPRLVRLFVGPTAGYRIDEVDDVWRVKIVEQGRGNRYSINTNPYSISRVTNGEFVKVQESHIFANNTALVLYESVESENIIKSAFVPFAPVEVNNTIQQFEENIRVVTNNENLLFFTQKIDGETIGLVVNVSNPKETRVLWESRFSNWLPRWGRNTSITITTPISEFAPGYVYLLDPEGEDPVHRLTDIPIGGSAFIDTSSGFFVLHEFEIAGTFAGKTTITDQFKKTNISLPITLPEKCDGFNGVFVCGVPNTIPARTISGYETRFPDSWYQGDLVFNDSIILIDAVSGKKQIVLSPNQKDIAVLSGGTKFDVINPRISGDGKFLFFVNKGDLSLWMLRL